jgi:hypothetical protein
VSYNVYSTALEVDISSILYPQTPLCGRTVAEVKTNTITPSTTVITVDSAKTKFTVSTSDKTKHGVYTVVH